MFQTADLCDDFIQHLQVAQPGMNNYGGETHFCGPIETIRTYEDNTKIRQLLESVGEGRVLVVDGGGSLGCALVGDRLAQLAIDNGWAGIIVNGCIRDSGVISKMNIGIKALGTNPKKSIKQQRGEIGGEVFFHQVKWRPGDYVYSDEDGIVIANEPILK